MQRTWKAATVAGLVMAAGAAAAIVGTGVFMGDTSSSGAAARSAASTPAQLSLTQKADPTGAGIITTFAGTGVAGDGGDGGPALQAQLAGAGCLRYDAQGNLYFCSGNRVRRISPAGVITAFAGDGQVDYAGYLETPFGEGLAATRARFGEVSGVAIDKAGQVYIADAANRRIHRVTTDGIIRTYAGLGSNEPPDRVIGVPYSGDGSHRSSATLVRPAAMLFDAAGNLVFRDNVYIRKIAPDGIITTFAGNGSYTQSGDGGPAREAGMEPESLAMDAQGNLFFNENNDGGRVRRITPGGVITTVVGGGAFGFDPVALSTRYDVIGGVAVDGLGNLFFDVDGALMRVNAAGIQDIYAGQYEVWYDRLITAPGYGGDGGPATAAKLQRLRNLAIDPAGNLVVGDSLNNRLRRITPAPARPMPMGVYAFQPFTELPVVTSPQAVAIADVNGDRRDDLLVNVDTAGDSDALQVFLQKADGTLAAFVQTPTAALARMVGTADFNHDGRADVLQEGNGKVSIGLGTATGQFQLKALAARGGLISSPKAIDVNRDGLLDVVVGEATSPLGLSVHFGDGRGGFAAPRALASPMTSWGALHTADFNGDGQTDLAAYYAVSSGVTAMDLLAQRSDGSFASMQRQDLTGFERTATLGDWNGDGLTDVLHVRNADYDDGWMDLRFQRAAGGVAPPVTMASHEPGAVHNADINGDGLDDLLVGRGNGGGLALLPQGGGVLQPQVRYVTPVSFVEASGYRDAMMASGDLNGDGCRDVVMGYTSTPLVLYRGRNCRPPQAPHDTDGDRRGDVVWRNTTTGANEMWRGANAAERLPMTAVAGADWKIVGVADFNADGKADLLWRNGVTGANDLWRSGLATQRQAIAAEINTAWRVAGVGDFDNDGRHDIFWRHAGTGANGIWNGADRSRSQSASAVADQNWQVAGIGDFTGDAKDDVLWRNAATGANDLWPAGSMAQRRPITAVTVVSWKIAGVADFNGDRVADILWRNDSTGANVLWLYGKATAQRTVATVADVNWQVAGTADYDADGRADILWRHKLSGANELWSEGNVRFRKVLPTVGTAWSVVPQR